jgi:hypothetical protein
MFGAKRARTKNTDAGHPTSILALFIVPEPIRPADNKAQGRYTWPLLLKRTNSV